MKNILITGGAGFIGSNLSLTLLKKGYRVTVLDNLSKQIHGDNPEVSSPLYISIKDKVNFIQGSINDRLTLEKAIKNQDIIVHFAAETGTGQSMYQIEHYSSINIGGTALLLDILTNNKHTVKKIIVASSRAIYGEGKYINKQGLAVYPGNRSSKDMDSKNFEVFYNGDRNLKLVATDEESLIHPSSVYGITKQVQEQLIMTVCPSIGINSMALRYQNVYGPGQSLSNPYTGILSIFSTQIMNDNEINVFEDGKESRDFVFIDDVVDATVLSIESSASNNEIFNVGSGVATTVREVVDKLLNLYNKNVSVKISGNYRIGDIRHNYADLSKIEKLLNFKPKVSFDEGLKLFVRWVKGQKSMKNSYLQSIEEMKTKGLFK